MYTNPRMPRYTQPGSSGAITTIFLNPNQIFGSNPIASQGPPVPYTYLNPITNAVYRCFPESREWMNYSFFFDGATNWAYTPENGNQQNTTEPNQFNYHNQVNYFNQFVIPNARPTQAQTYNVLNPETQFSGVHSSPRTTSSVPVNPLCFPNRDISLNQPDIPVANFDTAPEYRGEAQTGSNMSINLKTNKDNNQVHSNDSNDIALLPPIEPVPKSSFRIDELVDTNTTPNQLVIDGSATIENANECSVVADEPNINPIEFVKEKVDSEIQVKTNSEQFPQQVTLDDLVKVLDRVDENSEHSHSDSSSTVSIVVDEELNSNLNPTMEPTKSSVNNDCEEATTSFITTIHDFPPNSKTTAKSSIIEKLGANLSQDHDKTDKRPEKFDILTDSQLISHLQEVINPIITTKKILTSNEGIDTILLVPVSKGNINGVTDIFMRLRRKQPELLPNQPHTCLRHCGKHRNCQDNERKLATQNRLREKSRLKMELFSSVREERRAINVPLEKELSNRVHESKGKTSDALQQVNEATPVSKSDVTEKILEPNEIRDVFYQFDEVTLLDVRHIADSVLKSKYGNHDFKATTENNTTLLPVVDNVNETSKQKLRKSKSKKSQMISISEDQLMVDTGTHDETFQNRCDLIKSDNNDRRKTRKSRKNKKSKKYRDELEIEEMVDSILKDVLEDGYELDDDLVSESLTEGIEHQVEVPNTTPAADISISETTTVKVQHFNVIAVQTESELDQETSETIRKDTYAAKLAQVKVHDSNVPKQITEKKTPNKKLSKENKFCKSKKNEFPFDKSEALQQQHKTHRSPPSTNIRTNWDINTTSSFEKNPTNTSCGQVKTIDVERTTKDINEVENLQKELSSEGNKVKLEKSTSSKFYKMDQSRIEKMIPFKHVSIGGQRAFQGTKSSASRRRKSNAAHKVKISTSTSTDNQVGKFTLTNDDFPHLESTSNKPKEWQSVGKNSKQASESQPETVTK